MLIRPPIAVLVLNALRHQRFSSVLTEDEEGSNELCSTPYGIRGSADEVALMRGNTVLVLNALRHQRFSRAGEAEDLADLAASAQRLTASEVQQRLNNASYASATSCSTPYGIRGSAEPLEWIKGTRRLVLNALRHQRFSSCGSWNADATLLSCSTPYGIRGSADPRHYRGGAPGDVLNALRHQRFSSCKCHRHRHYSVMCSTPYGIRGSAVC